MKALLIIVVLFSVLIYALNTAQTQTSHTSALVATDRPFFTVQKQGSDFVLNWATDAADEGRVEVQKSFNEQTFETISTIKNEGANARQRHTYIDKTPFERTVHEVKLIYYRLKFVEPNLIYTYSKTVTVVRETEDFPPVQ